ncbi:MAG: hypothetical protein ABEH78_06275 [Haloferacaceae archaeon]
MMGDDSPTEHLLETGRGRSAPDRHDGVLVAIPVIYVAATAVGLSTRIAFPLALGGASAFAYAMVGAVLFLYPP